MTAAQTTPVGTVVDRLVAEGHDRGDVLAVVGSLVLASTASELHWLDDGTLLLAPADVDVLRAQLTST